MSDSNSKRSSESDWSRVDAMGDSDIDQSDVPARSREFFAQAVVRQPDGLVDVRLALPSALWAWFRSQPGPWSDRMVAALRIYRDAHAPAVTCSEPGIASTAPKNSSQPDVSSSLESSFDEAMMNLYRRALSEANYRASEFHVMLLQNKGVKTARILLHKPSVSDGYTALWERGRLDLTVEALIVEHPSFHPLFTADEVAIARERLRKYNYSPTIRAASA